jgi:hypothetical protein
MAHGTNADQEVAPKLTNIDQATRLSPAPEHAVIWHLLSALSREA